MQIALKASKKGGKMSDSTVWIVNYAGHDHSTAEEYGRLDFLTRGYVSMGSLDRLFFTVTEAIEKTSPDDYLLLSGLIALNALAASIWLQRHGNVRLLLWDQKLGKYRLLAYSKNQIDQLFEKLLISEADRPKSVAPEVHSIDSLEERRNDA